MKGLTYTVTCKIADYDTHDFPWTLSGWTMIETNQTLEQLQARQDACALGRIADFFINSMCVRGKIIDVQYEKETDEP